MKKDLIKKIGMVAAVALVVALPVIVSAQNLLQQPVVTRLSDITSIVRNILTWLATIVMTIAIIMLLWSAILFLTAGQSETAHSKAKSVLIYAIVGIAVAILAWSVQPFIEAILNKTL